MKKNFFRLLAGVLAIAMLLALAACGGKDGSSSEGSSSSQASGVESSSAGSEDQESSGLEANSEAGDASGLVDGKYASIQAFLDDPQISEQINAMVDALAEGDMGIAVSANENKLVYTFTFAEFEEGTDTDAVAESLEKNMADQASVFENIANSIKEVVNVEDPKVVVAYNAADGTEIYSQEFSAQ